MRTRIIQSILFVLFCSCVLGNIHAEGVKISTIKKVATNAYAYYAGNELVKESIKDFIPLKEANNVYAYICNFEKGFVIVSSDNIATPILGYGFSGPIDTVNMAPAFKYLLEGYQKEIRHAQQNNLPVTEELQTAWASLINDIHPKGIYHPNTYLIHSIWAQEGHNVLPSNFAYNYHCCQAFNTRILVGCGGVALGQILRYWACQVNPHGIVYNTCIGDNINLSNVSYQWENMPMTQSNEYTSEFLYHCAFAINSNFGITTFSNTYSVEAVLKYNYGFANASLFYRSSYSDDAWISILKSNIDQRYPIFYAGCDAATGGHGWVMDGYDDSGFFHCNFGWGGTYDGYFHIDNIAPGSRGPYNYNHEAIVNIYPTDNTTTLIQNATLTSGTQTGQRIYLENCNIGSGANVIIDASCGTAIYGPFSMTTGSILTIQ